MYKDFIFDTSITERKGCNYCLARKVINTNGTDFRIYADNNNEEKYICTTDDDVYKSFDVRYCPICGRKLI